MKFIAFIAVVIIALPFLGYGLLANLAAYMSDTDAKADKGGCACFVIGLALIGLAVWIAFS